MKAASQQSAVASCAAAAAVARTGRVLLGVPWAVPKAGYCVASFVALAKRAKRWVIYARASLTGRQQPGTPSALPCEREGGLPGPGAPRRRQGRIWQLVGGSSLPLVWELPACPPGASGTGAWWVTATLQGRVSGSRGEELAVGAVRSGGGCWQFRCSALWSRDATLARPQAAPRAAGAASPSHTPAPLVPFRLLQDLGQVLVLAHRQRFGSAAVVLDGLGLVGVVGALVAVVVKVQQHQQPPEQQEQEGHDCRGEVVVRGQGGHRARAEVGRHTGQVLHLHPMMIPSQPSSCTWGNSAETERAPETGLQGGLVLECPLCS